MSLFLKIVSIVCLFFSPVVIAPSVKAVGSERYDIVLTKNIDSLSNIWVMSSNTGYQKQVTFAGGHDPVWSLDGSKIAFVDNNGHLQLTHANGKHSKKLTANTAYADTAPVWSADGSKIAFVRHELAGKKRSAVFSIKLNGKSETNISGWSNTDNFQSPSWSPDGTKIVYQQTNQTDSNLLIKNIKNDSIIQLTSMSDVVDAQAKWAPNGKKILYKDSSSEIYTVWPDGTHRTVISDGESYEATWSPDGERIIFLEDPTGSDISISESDGTIVQIPVKKHQFHTISSPSLSSNNKTILFVMNTAKGDSAIFALKINESQTTQNKLTSGLVSQPSWRPRSNI